MLCDQYYRPRLLEFDQQIFRALVPPDHYLRRAQRAIPWDKFYDVLAPYYRADLGRPAESPVLMLKLEYLRYHDNLSDRQVIGRAATDVAYREFLQLGVESSPPTRVCRATFADAWAWTASGRCFARSSPMRVSRGWSRTACG